MFVVAKSSFMLSHYYYYIGIIILLISWTEQGHAEINFILSHQFHSFPISGYNLGTQTFSVTHRQGEKYPLVTFSHYHLVVFKVLIQYKTQIQFLFPFLLPPPTPNCAQLERDTYLTSLLACFTLSIYFSMFFLGAASELSRARLRRRGD